MNIQLLKNKDLIEIYENGDFEGYKESFCEYKEDIKEYHELVNYFTLKYFPNLKYPGVDFSHMSYSEILEFDTKNIKEILPLINFKKVIEERYPNYEQDSKFKRLNLLSNELCDEYNADKCKMYNSLLYKTEKVRDFAKNYLCKLVKPIIYTTLLEEARKYGKEDIIEFITSNPLKDVYTLEIKKRKLCSRLEKIREINLMSYDEMATYLSLNPSDVRDIEKGQFDLNNFIINKYAALADIEIKELLVYDEFILMYMHRKSIAGGNKNG